MPQFNDLTGEKYGKWTVLKRAGKEFAWMCRCDCGVTRKVFTSSLRTGRSASCGCVAKEQLPEQTRQRMTTHGGSHSPEYRVWSAMKDRCTNPNTKNFADYGGRGIKVCDAWMDFESFMSDMGPRPDGTSLDRIDNDRNYEPSNCRWATRLEQNRNTRRNRFLTHDGQTKCITEWTALKGFKENTIRQRLSMGWEVARAIDTPIRILKPRKRK